VEGEWQQRILVRFFEVRDRFPEQLCNFFIAHTEFKRSDAVSSDDDE
jgi:hypothetical protein